MHSRFFLRGFTLLEVLIALVIFSIGLIGVAGMLAISVQTNHSAYLRTQASFLAGSMADRMHANNIGVWSGNYIGAYSKTTGSAAFLTTCLGATTCSPAQIATRDGIVWSSQLASFLPNPAATIACPAPPAPPDADQVTEHPPYTGQCTITINWSESALQQGAAANLETLVWTFQP